MFKHYIFDLDGTIVNTKEIHRECFNTTLIKFGHPPIKPEDSHLFEAMPSFVKLEKYKEVYGRDVDVKKFLAAKNDCTRETLKHNADIYDEDIKYIFKSLFLDDSVSMVSICTNCTLETAQVILEKMEINKYIHNLFHNQTCAPKPSPEMYNLALEKGHRIHIKDNETVIFEDNEKGLAAAFGSSPLVNVVRVSGPESIKSFFL